MEKPDKAKRILIQEYQFLKRLQGVQGVLQVHEFINWDIESKQNFFVMDLKGTNVANFKKNIGKQFTEMIACNILL